MAGKLRVKTEEGRRTPYGRRTDREVGLTDIVIAAEDTVHTGGRKPEAPVPG